jgi:EAL domain-containing protein (putative c-di-GMP-specific phosphodiesterase class I)
VNISPSHLIAPGFIEFVENAIEKSGVPPNRIIFEITEDVMIENFERVMAVFKKLRRIGIWISLDDFGSGYSSLNYLAKFDIDELKIDKSFVDQIEINGKIDSMLEAIMQLAVDYDINVVAEGVETQMQYAKLLEIGCDEIQGYYFSRPEPLNR